MQGFYGMMAPQTPDHVTEGKPGAQLIHSIYNTSKTNTKVILVQTDKWEEAIDQLTNIDNILKNNIAPQFHDNVFIPEHPPSLTGRKADSISSCNYSSYASTLLTNFNPQDGDSKASPMLQKRLRTANITYAKAVTPTSSPQASQTSVSTLTDFDKLYETMSAKFGEQFRSKVSISDLEKQVEKTSTEISEIRSTFDTRLTSIQSSIDQLSTRMHAVY
jgi:hypothetical protein